MKLKATAILATILSLFVVTSTAEAKRYHSHRGYHATAQRAHSRPHHYTQRTVRATHRVANSAAGMWPAPSGQVVRLVHAHSTRRRTGVQPRRQLASLWPFHRTSGRCRGRLAASRRHDHRSFVQRPVDRGNPAMTVTPSANVRAECPGRSSTSDRRQHRLRLRKPPRDRGGFVISRRLSCRSAQALGQQHVSTTRANDRFHGLVRRQCLSQHLGRVIAARKLLPARPRRYQPTHTG